MRASSCGMARSVDELEDEEVVYILALAVIALLSLLCNFLICSAVFKWRHLRNTSNVLVLSLAVVDSLAPILRIFTIISPVLSEDWKLNCTWCSFSSYIGVFLYSFSLGHIIFMMLEKHTLFKYPLKHVRYFTTKNMFVALFLSWTVPLMVLFTLYKIKCFYIKDLISCELILDGILLPLMFLICFYVCPLVAICVLYGSAYKALKRYFRLKITDSYLYIDNRKSLQTTLVLSILFFLVWLPYFIVSYLRTVGNVDIPAWVARLVFSLTYAYCYAKTIVYSVMDAELRRAIACLLCLRSKPYPVQNSADSDDDLHPDDPEYDMEYFLFKLRTQPYNKRMSIVPHVWEPYHINSHTTFNLIRAATNQPSKPPDYKSKTDQPFVRYSDIDLSRAYHVTTNSPSQFQNPHLDMYY